MRRNKGKMRQTAQSARCLSLGFRRQSDPSPCPPRSTRRWTGPGPAQSRLLLPRPRITLLLRPRSKSCKIDLMRPSAFPSFYPATRARSSRLHLAPAERSPSQTCLPETGKPLHPNSPLDEERINLPFSSSSSRSWWSPFTSTSLSSMRDLCILDTTSSLVVR